MNGLEPAEIDHLEARRRWARLSQLQTAEENWEQGRDAYERKQWMNAIKLLGEVAKTQAPQSAQAVELLARATAARDVLDAEEVEQNGEFPEALAAFEGADNIFSNKGSDPATTDYVDRANAGIERVKRQLAIDAEAAAILNRAKYIMQIARQLAEILTLADVEWPNNLFVDAVDLLNKAPTTDSSLRLEIERALLQTRREWRDAYLAGVQVVLASQIPHSLDRAKSVGVELYKRGLLDNPAHKLIYRELMGLDVEQWAYERGWSEAMNSLRQQAGSAAGHSVEIERLISHVEAARGSSSGPAAYSLSESSQQGGNDDPR
jgi:hypothetical protein